METKEVIIESPVTAAGITIIPIASVTLNHRHSHLGISFSGSKQPVGVVVISSSAKRAFRTTGEEVSLDELLPEAPDIKRVLEET